ncbi:hypothetical protein EV193_105100 [Herbihabitans rhizosphaerae]|uniref:DUF5753 domain-containing protein n=2 Tax=Herbihabitans rhizosphaerae TaxID=1872711 RepID=A0A4Q7KMK2_9PSEU|nr:hypothetical protein EV193_105100 [Herbihabitans rhizosphaerae]
MTGDALAKAVGMSPSKVSRVEHCEAGIYLDEVEKLLDFHRVSKRKRVELLDIARHAQERGWLRVNNPSLPKDWQAWLDFEAEANALSMYTPLTIPGLLQTSEYARAIIEATGTWLSDNEIDAMVASRMSRQGLLSRSTPLRLDTVIEESVLTRPLGDPEMQARQLRHLVNSAHRPNITIRVLPHAAGLHAGLNGPFVMLDYDDETSLVLVETRVSSLFLDEQEHIDDYEAVWHQLSDLAFDLGETTEFLRKAADRLAL